MKKKAKVSIFTVTAVIVGIVGILYFFLYLVPANREKGLIRAETLLFTTQAKLIEPYLDDHTPLLEKIQEIEDSIAELHATGYTNASTFNMVLAENLQRYQLELTSLTLEEETDYDTESHDPCDSGKLSCREGRGRIAEVCANACCGSFRGCKFIGERTYNGKAQPGQSKAKFLGK